MASLYEVTKFFERQKKNYPNALGCRRSFFVATPMIEPFVIQEPPFDFTPAEVVSHNLLFEGYMTLLEEIATLLEEIAGEYKFDHEAMQGYVDAIGLFVITCQAKFKNTPSANADDLSRLISKWDTLSLTIRQSTQTFLQNNKGWAEKELLPKDHFDGKIFMHKLENRIGTSHATLSYKHGTRMAKDTLLIYVDFVIALLKGNIGS